LEFCLSKMVASPRMPLSLLLKKNLCADVFSKQPPTAIPLPFF
jgi:hypothetical protein